MNYSSYTALDFARDPDFRNWVKAPSAQSDAFWESWVAAHPDQKEVIREARELVLVMQFRTYTAPAGKAEELKARIDTAYAQHLEAESRTRSTRRLNPFLRGGWSRLAAAVAAILLVAFAGVLLYGRFARVTYTTGYGETQRLTLPDGSVVMLNANSELSYPRNWSRAAERRVTLQGEAYFSVVHTADDQKFVVQTDDRLRVEVLGTEFNVTNRHGQSRVVLNSGKVKVSLQTPEATRQVLMQPGEMVVASGEEATLAKERVKTEVYTSWRNQVLTFDDTPLTSIAQLIKDHYGVEVVIPDTALAGRRFTGVAPSGDVDVLLTKISRVFDVQISREEDRILIRENP